MHQHGSLPRGAVLQEKAAPVWVPHGVTSPASKPAPVWAPLSTGLAGPARSLLQRGLPTGSQPPSSIHLLWCGVPSMGYKWSSAPPWTSMDCRGTTCLTMVFSTSCKGRLSALTFRAPPTPPSSLTLMSAELFLSHRLTLLSTLPFLLQSFFLPLLKYVITEALPPSLTGLALGSGRPVLEPAGTGFYQTWGKLLAASHRSHPIAPPLPKPCHANP